MTAGANATGGQAEFCQAWPLREQTGRMAGGTQPDRFAAPWCGFVVWGNFTKKEPPGAGYIFGCLPAPPPMKILLVEDHAELAGSMASYLVQENYVCEVAASFDAAREKLALFSYDCVVLDMSCPTTTA